MDNSDTKAILPGTGRGREDDKVEDGASSNSRSQRENHMADPDVAERRCCTSNTRAYFTAGILCFINLLNYMDRYTIAG